MTMMYKTPTTAAAPALPALLQVSDAPWPGDTRLVMHVQPGAPVGFADVRLGMGRGTKGRGQRPGDDHAIIVATLRRLSEHLAQYALDYEAACLQDTQGATLCPCGEPTTNTEYCAACIPF